MSITIYQRNIWPEIVAQQRPRYMALHDFTISLEIEDGPAADALDADPVLHQELIDKINAFVHDKTTRLLDDYVYRHETKAKILINNGNFEGLTHEYREFDVFIRYLQAVTNDNLRQLIGTTIAARAKDKADVVKYVANIAVKLVLNVAGITVSSTLLIIGTASAIATSGVTAIPGLVVGFYSLVQSFAELAREVYKAAETLKMAGADALSSLEQLEKRYKGAGGGRIGVTEVAAGVVNKLFSGFVELNTITTLSSKFELWGNKILVVDQKTHGLAKKLPELFRRIEELQRLIMLAERPPVPSRDGCKLKVPPPLPSKQGRPSQHPPKPTPPEIPSKGGRIPVVAVKEILGLRVPPPVPSTLGRPAPPVMPAPTTVSHPVVESRNVKAKTLAELRGKVNTTVTKVADLQAEVKKHKFLQERYKGALDGLKGRKPTEALFLETLGNVTVAIAKSGITLGLGGFDLSNGVKTVAETVGNVSQFVVGSIMDATVLSADLAENMGDLGSALREKAKLERLRK